MKVEMEVEGGTEIVSRLVVGTHRYRFIWKVVMAGKGWAWVAETMRGAVQKRERPSHHPYSSQHFPDKPHGTRCTHT